jgi:hypothetical protein
MKGLFRFSALSAALAAVVVSQAVVWRSDRTDAQILAFGTDFHFAGIGQLWVGGGFGTATFLGHGNGSAWLISAAHVIGNNGTGTFQFFGGPSFSVTQGWQVPGVDVSVAKITGWNLNPWTPTLNTGSIVPNTFTISAGYGGSCREADRGTTGLQFDNKRRGFETKIVGLSGGFVIDRFDSPSDPNVCNLEGFGAPGDSGSPLLDPNGAILGVLTSGDPEFYGGINNYSVISASVAQQIQQHTGVPVPEPVTVTAFALGLAGILRRRRKA